MGVMITSSATYQTEDYSKVKDELAVMFPRHWDEIALNKDKIKLNIDWEVYDRAHSSGKLVIITARDGVKLIGYWVGFLVENPHYKGYRIAQTDIFYILPESRRGRVGINLFRFLEDEMRARGVVKIITNSKLHRDVGPLFVHLGYNPVETVYTKYIGS